MTISIANASVTVTDSVTSTRYIHDFVTNITITPGRSNNLTVSPQGGGNGIVYETGLTTPVMSEMVVRGMPVELEGYYKAAFKNKTRFDVMIVDTRTGERYDLNQSIIRDDPRAVSIGEGEQSLDQAINFASPPSGFEHISATAQ